MVSHNKYLVLFAAAIFFSALSITGALAHPQGHDGAEGLEGRSIQDVPPRRGEARHIHSGREGMKPLLHRHDQERRRDYDDKKERIQDFREHRKELREHHHERMQDFREERRDHREYRRDHRKNLKRDIRDHKKDRKDHRGDRRKERREKNK